MKYVLIIIAMIALPLSAQSNGNQSHAGSGSQIGKANPTRQENPATLSTETVEPGDPEFNNGDTKTTNDPDSEGDIKVTPKNGTPSSSTTVTFKGRSKGSLTGMDGNDTVNVSSRGQATISGTGGTVNLTGSNASAAITNTGAAGGASITATGPGGTTVTIPPGSTAVVSS